MSGDCDPTLEICLLGTPRWQRPGQPPQPLASRDAALLAVLAQEGAIGRDRLAAWLWPGSSQDKANLSLRQRLFRLRRQCGHPLVDAGLSLRLAHGVQMDLHRDPFPTEGELLAGQDFSEFDAFEDWLQQARRALGQRQADGLAGQAAALEARGALAEAIQLCERIVHAHPTTEHAWRRLMRLHWLRADRAAAIASFERFEHVVCQEHGLRPSAETLALLDRIEHLETPAAPPGASLPPGLLHPPRLVGRASALQAMADAWPAGRALMVLADGGMGKSRLLDAFVQGRDGVLRARARPGDAAQPYATLAHTLADALERYAPALPTTARAELARVLPQLGSPSATPAHQQRLWLAVEQAWMACAANGLQAIVIDDLHWADSASLEQLRWQLASPPLATLRWAFATRPGEDTPAAPLLRGWLGDSLRVQPVTLTPWGLAELTALLPTLGLPATLASDPQLAPTLLRQTGGQPFFVLETLKTLSAATVAGAPMAPALAPAVGAMIERRVLRLGAGARQLLQLLAVADGELPLAVAARSLQRGLSAVGDDWAELAAAQLVHRSGVAHDLVRECVLAALPTPTLQALHLALAEGLATTPGADPARLAPHWQAGEAWAQAGQAWQVAAASAVHTGRLAEAEALYERAADALARAGDADQQVQALAAAQPVHLLRHGADAALAALAPRLADVQVPSARARLLLLQAEAEMSRMQPAAALQATTQALWLLGPDGSGGQGAQAGRPDRSAQAASLLIDAQLMHGRALAWTGAIDEGLSLLRRACDATDRTGDLRLRLRARCTLNDVLVPAGLRVESVKHQQQAVALARQLGDDFETAVCVSNLAVHQLLVADAAGAYAAGQEALRAFAAMDVQHVNRSMCAGVFAIAAAHLGRFDEALAASQPSSDGDPADPVRRTLRNTLATLALWRGLPDEAARWLASAQPDADLPPTVLLTSLLVRLRWQAWTGADTRPAHAALHALGTAHPGLRDDAHYYRGWALWDPPADALARLDRLATREREDGAIDMARSLDVMALHLTLQQADPAAAARRAVALQAGWPAADDPRTGLHPAVYPPEALADLAEGLALAGEAQASGARWDQGRQWIARARLPDPSRALREAFERVNPVNRRLAGPAPASSLTGS